MPNYSVSIMEFANGYVVHETQYFANAFGAPEWRTALAEPMPGRDIARAWPGPGGARSLRRQDEGRLRHLDSYFGADDANERDRNSSQREDWKKGLPPGNLERKTGFEPATLTLARWCFPSWGQS